MIKKRLYYLLTIITFLIVLFGCMDVVLENDSFYSIKIGQFILDNGIDMKDHYSWISGLPYTYPHWLFDVIVALVYNLFSFKGLYVLTYILYGLVGVCLYICLNKISNNKLLSIILSIVSIIIIRNYAACRAQILSYSLIVLFYYNLLRLNKTSSKKYIIYMFIISLILVNTHVAVWPFLLILFLPFFVETLFNWIIKKRKINIKINVDKYNVKLLLITFILIFLSGLITPLGLVPYTYLINTMKGVTQYYILEHQPILLWNYKIFFMYIVVLLFVLHNKKVKLNDIFLLLGLTIMMLSSRRHRTLFVLLTVFIFVKYFDIKIFNKINLKKYKYFYKVVGVTSVILLIWYPILNLSKDKLNEKMVSVYKYPVEAVKYIKNNLDYKNMRIYNSYNIGSYLLFNDIKVYIDSRADLYTKEFNKEFDYFLEYNEMDSNNYKEIFEKYSIDYILIYADSALNSALSSDENFELVYEDNNFLIYVEKVYL